MESNILKKLAKLGMKLNKHIKMITILFLTACVNPKGMTYTKLSNPEIRLQQYKDALD